MANRKTIIVTGFLNLKYKFRRIWETQKKLAKLDEFARMSVQLASFDRINKGEDESE